MPSDMQMQKAAAWAGMSCFFFWCIPKYWDHDIVDFLYRFCSPTLGPPSIRDHIGACNARQIHLFHGQPCRFRW